MTKDSITQDIVDAVEHEVGMGCGAWDMVDPKEIILASYNIVLGVLGSPPAPDVSLSKSSDGKKDQNKPEEG